MEQLNKLLDIVKRHSTIAVSIVFLLLYLLTLAWIGVHYGWVM